MNEFIVWDKENSEFIDENKPWWVLGFYPNGDVYNQEEHKRYSKDERYVLLKDIGITDIDNKKIYADSSIVEFTIREDGIKLPVIGYFKFDPIFLRYYIRIIEDKGVENRYYLGLQVVPWDKYCDYIRDIKIIDTIQENKLGLIK